MASITLYEKYRVQTMFFEDKEEFTKYGYYLVHGIKTLSKFEAWKLSGGDMANVRFIFSLARCEAISLKLEFNTELCVGYEL